MYFALALSVPLTLETRVIDTPSSVIGRSSHWDAVVLGSGPAGALAAYLLARQSLRTLLIEKQAFPRYKVCGGCLNSRALRVLDEVGLGQLCDTVGANSVNCVRLYASGKSATIRMPLGRSVSRQLFDAALVEYAVAAGVEFRDKTRARVLPADGPCEYRRVELRTETGQTEIVAGKVIVVADGLGHPTLRQLSDFRVSVSPASYVGLGANTGCHTSNIEPNTITMAVGRHGYLGSVLVENDTINMAAAVNANAIKKMGAEKVIATIISDSGVSLDFTHDRKWVGTRPLTCRSSLVVGERLFLIGDATGYVEPFTGEGMASALLISASCRSLGPTGLSEMEL